jgi:putative intracellular protease/amidase
MVREKPAQLPPYPAEKARGGEIILRRPLAAHRFHSRGRKATSYRSIKTDVINAGAKWEDSPVVVDQGVITSRQPGDLEAFSAKIIEEIAEGRHTKRSAAA